MLLDKKKMVCPYCKLEFIPLRTNQKFDSKECRVAFHNLNSNIIRKSMAYINKPLLKNYKIFLELLNNKNEAVFHQEFLIGKGVSFKVFTNLQKYNGGYAYAVFEFWYYKIDDVNYKIKKS
jgi:hypothetical protein